MYGRPFISITKEELKTDLKLKGIERKYWDSICDEFRTALQHNWVRILEQAIHHEEKNRLKGQSQQKLEK